MIADTLYDIAEKGWQLRERLEAIFPASTVVEDLECCILKVEGLAADSAGSEGEPEAQEFDGPEPNVAGFSPAESEWMEESYEPGVLGEQES